MNRRNIAKISAWALLAVGILGCVENATPTKPGSTTKMEVKSGTEGGTESTKPAEPAMKLTGSISINGSSTVFPITQKVSVAFKDKHPDVTTEVGESGTSSGFAAFIKGDLDIVDASRQISEKESAACKEKGWDMVGFTIAIDGLSVVVNAKNDWCDCLTVAELKKIWDKDSQVKSWKEVRSSFPDQELKLYGAGTKSGTFEFFTEKINGKAKQSRTDYSPSENDNLLVKGVDGNLSAMGYFGYAYYIENKDKLKAIAIKVEDGDCVGPTEKSVLDSTYYLSRPIYIFTSKQKLAEKPEVAAFIRYYLTEGLKHVEEAKYFKAPVETQQAMVKQFEELTSAK